MQGACGHCSLVKMEALEHFLVQQKNAHFSVADFLQWRAIFHLAAHFATFWRIFCSFKTTSGFKIFFRSEIRHRKWDIRLGFPTNCTYSGHATSFMDIFILHVLCILRPQQNGGEKFHNGVGDKNCSRVGLLVQTTIRFKITSGQRIIFWRKSASRGADFSWGTV